MPNERDNNERWDGGRSLSSSVSKDPNKVDVGKLTDMIISDGRFLGFPMPKDMLDQIHQYLPIILIYGATSAQKLASDRWGPTAGKVAGVSAALIVQIAETIQNFYFLTTSLTNLHATMKPVAKAAGSSSALIMDNEALQDLRGKIISAFWTKMIDTGVSATGSIFAIAEVLQKVDVASKHIEKSKALKETGGDPKKIADILEGEVYGVGATATAAENKALTAEQMKDAFEEVARRRQLRFKEGFETFKVGKAKETTELLQAEINKVAEGNYSFVLGRLKDHGMDVTTLENRLNQLESMGFEEISKRGANFNPQAEMKSRIEQWRADLNEGKQLEYTVDRALQKQYAVDHGTFNREEVIRSLTEENKAREQILKEVSGTKEKTKIEEGIPHMLNIAKGWLSGLARNFLVSLVGGTALEKLKKPLAAERIAYLDKILTRPKDDPDWKPSERVPPMEDRNQKQSGGGRNNREGLTDAMGYTRYIHEIIQTHQNTRGRAEVSERFFQHFENADWRDNKIQEMRDEDLTPYEFALKHITKRILDGKLAVSILLELVGNKHGKKIVQADGRTFGPAGSGTDDASAKAAILKLIDDYSMSANTSKELTPEELSKKKGKLLFGEKDMKEKLETKGIDPEYRAFVFRLYSDVISSNPAICKELGIDAERCEQLRKECVDLNFMMDGVLGSLEQKLHELQDDRKALEEFRKLLKLTPAEEELISSLNERKRKEGGNVPDLTKKPEDTEALYALAFNSLLLLEKDASVQFDAGGTPGSFWKSVQHRVEEMRNPPEVEAASDRNEHEDPRTQNKRNAYQGHDGEEQQSPGHREKLEKPHRDKGEKKWAADKNRDDDGFSGNVRRRRAETEVDPARGGLV